MIFVKSLAPSELVRKIMSHPILQAYIYESHYGHSHKSPAILISVEIIL